MLPGHISILHLQVLEFCYIRNGNFDALECKFLCSNIRLKTPQMSVCRIFKVKAVVNAKSLYMYSNT